MKITFLMVVWENECQIWENESQIQQDTVKLWKFNV